MIIAIREPININWNEFESNIPQNFNGTCYIHIDNLSKNVKSDMQKIVQISNIEGLQEIEI